MKVLITCKFNTTFPAVIFTRKCNRTEAFGRKYCHQKSVIGLDECASAGILICFLAKCIILVFLGVLTTGIQNSFILQVRCEPHTLSVTALCSEASRFSITKIWYA